MKPNSIGSKILYLNPSRDVLTTTNLAAIDGAYDNATLAPYAKSATVRDDYDAYNFDTEDAGSTLVAGQRMAVGLFLSPENDKHNLLFQLSGKINLYLTGTNITVNTNFFFGRKATNNTVVSDKTAPQNTLEIYTMLPDTSIAYANDRTGGQFISQSIKDELFALENSGKFVWCFGVVIDNLSASDVALRGTIGALGMRKYSTEVSSFKPSRV